MLNQYITYFPGEEQSSSITAQINNDLLTAAIDSKNDTYHIEVWYRIIPNILGMQLHVPMHAIIPVDKWKSYQ